MSEPINEYEQERRQKREKLRELGIDPYGSRETGITSLATIRGSYKPEIGHDGGPVVKAAGRIVLKRDMGKLSFLSLRDETGDLQVALDKKRLPELDWKINDLLDLGDQIVVEGPLGVTKKGEITIWATSLKIASKSVLSPPGKWDGLSDIELRYRQRYVDLWANPEVMRVLKLRSAIVSEVRCFLADRGYNEVETPMMQPISGGAAARPFTTHHNALDIPLYMRIAPELYLKRLLVGGFSKVFELNRNFRNEGVSPRHNPEFTMLEAYEAFGCWENMAEMIEEMICHIAMKLLGTLVIERKNSVGEVTHSINLSRPWRRATMASLVEEKTGWKFDKRPLQEADPGFFDRLKTDADHDANYYRNLEHNLAKLSPAEQLFEVHGKLVEPTIVDPCYVTQVPSVIVPLARTVPGDSFYADVYELAINGQEVGNGYTELNDPDVQAANFATQVGDEAEKQKTDHDFLTALKYGMPPAGGLGLGIDRLVMMLTGAESIRDVILFPLMRPT